LSKDIPTDTAYSSNESRHNSNNNNNNLIDWITNECFHLRQGKLLAAMEAWELWQPILDATLPVHVLDGEMLPFPAATNEKDLDEITTHNYTLTDNFRVNTIFTKSHVAKGVVQTFVHLVGKELDLKGNDVLWLDAGAGSGSLLQFLPDKASVGVDLNTQHTSIYKKNFFDVSQDWLEGVRGSSFQHLCIISNPPFSEGSRGDYSIIIKFLEHATTQLKASFMGLIVPANLARVWRSSGLSIQLLYRMILPVNSFYDPSTNESKHIQCHFLYFDLRPRIDASEENKPLKKTLESSCPPRRQINIVAQRNKGMFPDISTATLTAAVVSGLGRAGVALGSSKSCDMTLRAKLDDRLQLFLDLNSKRPLSIVNSMSAQIGNHSLGWMAKSVRPPLALAMHLLSQKREVSNIMSPDQQILEIPAIVVNMMSGEGTLEYESLYPQCQPSFRIVGDRSPETIHQVAQNIKHLPYRPLMDFVIWDAQHLPLRDGIADSLVGDLPFAGSKKKSHQEPSADAITSQDKVLCYSRILVESVRILCASEGRAVLISADNQSLVHAIKKFTGNLKEVWQTKINIGGLTGRLFLLEKKQPCWKDINLVVEDPYRDRSHKILAQAQNVCSTFYLDDHLVLQQGKQKKTQDLITGVCLQNEYRHIDGTITHCYRLFFDPKVANMQAKALEKAIRPCLSAEKIIYSR